MNEVRLDLSALVYREDGWWIAHCLEMDVPAEGRTQREAIETLLKLLSVHVANALSEGDLASIFAPAPPDLWRLFSIAKRDRPLRRKPPEPINRLNVRELDLIQRIVMDQTLKYRDLLKILKRYGVQEDKSRGKGSERILSRIVAGRKRSIPTKCHRESDQKPKAVIRAIRRRLALTAEDGVSDEEFYGD